MMLPFSVVSTTTACSITSEQNKPPLVKKLKQSMLPCMFSPTEHSMEQSVSITMSMHDSEATVSQIGADDHDTSLYARMEGSIPCVAECCANTCWRNWSYFCFN